MVQLYFFGANPDSHH